MKTKEAINIVKELMNRDISVNEQIELFIKVTGLKRRSFFRFKKYLKTGILTDGSDKSFNYYQAKKGKFCYFCNSDKNLNIHHIRYEPEQIIVLCRKCHNKLHNLERESITLV